jgi:hypothetical protein
MKGLIIAGSLISVLLILYGTYKITRNYVITSSTHKALDFMFDKIFSSTCDSDNSPEKFAALANEIKYNIYSEALGKVLAPYKFRYKVAFFIFYRQYKEIPLGEAERLNSQV